MLAASNLDPSSLSMVTRKLEVHVCQYIEKSTLHVLDTVTAVVSWDMQSCTFCVISYSILGCSGFQEHSYQRFTIRISQGVQGKVVNDYFQHAVTCINCAGS